jgi:hypothetical protein
VPRPLVDSRFDASDDVLRRRQVDIKTRGGTIRPQGTGDSLRALAVESTGR